MIFLRIHPLLFAPSLTFALFIANKCTTELQKLIGEPSQVSQLKELRQELDSHVDCLNKKMETIQMVSTPSCFLRSC